MLAGTPLVPPGIFEILVRNTRAGSRALFPSSSMATQSDIRRSWVHARRSPRSVTPSGSAAPLDAGPDVPGDWPAHL